MWDQARLAEVAGNALQNLKFIVVSNREPGIPQESNGTGKQSSPAGGLTAALKPIVSALGGTWVAQGSAPKPRFWSSAMFRSASRSRQHGFGVRLLTIPPSLYEPYYEGLANQGLWPLCHNAYRKPVYRQADWTAYRRVNRLFADAVLEEAAGQPAVVFVQDYHLALVPRLLKSENPNLIVGHFWHIPWPAPELLQTFPWAGELLDGMLGNDVIGFHLPRHGRNFVDGVEEILGSDAECDTDAVRFFDHTTRVQTAPISIDFQRQTETAQSPEVTGYLEQWRARLGAVRYVGIGIDRCDYTKGIPERLRAIGALLEANPGLRGKLSFVQVAVPSRSGIPEYCDLTREVEQETIAINNRYGDRNWTPVLLEQRNLSGVEMMALHRLAHFCMVTPLHDGMNLVAKEFVASRFDNDGVLILSQFAGAARELTSAVQVNPFSETSLVSGITTALTMPPAERTRRIWEARRVVRENNIYHWAGKLIREFGSVASTPGFLHTAGSFRQAVASVA